MIRIILSLAIVIVPLGDCTIVQCCQCGVIMVRLGAHTVLVLSIDETAADTCRHVDQIQFDDAGDGTPVLLVETIACALLGGQFQVDA